MANCTRLVFGGDRFPMELAPGHAAIARKGIVQALGERFEEGWLCESEWPQTAERIMRQNAHELFDHQSALVAWNK